MRRPIAAALALFILTSATAAEARIQRSSAVRHEFQRMNPCPSTGERRGSCPGYIADHVKPLCAGGPDTTANMQWQTEADAKAKDRIERRQCARSMY